MSLRKHLTHTGFIAALAIGASALAPTGAAAHEPVDAQLIVVSGNGEVRVHPDSLSVDVGVETRAATVDEAKSQAARGLTSVLDAVRALDFPDLLVETRALTVTPIYAPNREESRPPRIIAYAASNHVSITIQHAPVDELGERGARIIDTALTAGANSISGLDFFIADPAPAQDEALAAAVHDAARDAAIIANAAGVSLGALHSVEETAGMRLMPRSITLPVIATPVEVEDILVTSNVTARFGFQTASR